MPRNGRPDSMASRATSSRPAARTPPCTDRRRRRPAARRRRRRPRAGVGGEAGVGADVLERLLGRAQVADAVVEHGDERPVGRHRVPLVAGTPAPSTRTASRRHRATPLKEASRMWWGFLPRARVTCSVMPADVTKPARTPPPGWGRRAACPGAAPRAGRPRRRGTGGPTGRGRRRPAPRRAEPNDGEAAHAGLVAQRLAEHLAQHDADVLDRVVGVDVEVAGGLHGEVEAAVPAELAEHVVVEREAGRDLGRARAVEVDA